MKASSAARKILNRFPQDVKDYFLKLDKRCEKNGITLLLGSGKALNAGGRCGGYFSEYERVLAVAIGGKFADVLCCAIHEESHLSQFLSPQSVWYRKGVNSGHSRFFRYLNGDRIYKLKDAAFSAIKIEADCERRAKKKMLKWSHIINIKKQQKMANAYILSYWHMLKTGQWPKKSPYHKRILAHCPSSLLRSFRNIPKSLEMAFDKYL